MAVCECRSQLPNPLHRIPEILEREEISVKQIARRMGISIRAATEQLDTQYDLSVEELCRWRKALGVPVSEILDIPDEGIHGSIRERALLVNIMKTVKSLQVSRSSPADTGLGRPSGGSTRGVDAGTWISAVLADCGKRPQARRNSERLPNKWCQRRWPTNCGSSTTRVAKSLDGILRLNRAVIANRVPSAVSGSCQNALPCRFVGQARADCCLVR